MVNPGPLPTDGAGDSRRPLRIKSRNARTTGPTEVLGRKPGRGGASPILGAAGALDLGRPAWFPRTSGPIRGEKAGHSPAGGIANRRGFVSGAGGGVELRLGGASGEHPGFVEAAHVAVVG